jgi:hypothetical protein
MMTATDFFAHLPPPMTKMTLSGSHDETPSAATNMPSLRVSLPTTTKQYCREL